MELDSPPRNFFASCFACMLMGKRHSEGKTYPVKLGNGIRLCENHLRDYLSTKLNKEAV